MNGRICGACATPGVAGISAYPPHAAGPRRERGGPVTSVMAAITALAVSARPGGGGSAPHARNQDQRHGRPATGDLLRSIFRRRHLPAPLLQGLSGHLPRYFGARWWALRRPRRGRKPRDYLAFRLHRYRQSTKMVNFGPLVPTRRVRTGRRLLNEEEATAGVAGPDGAGH